MRLLVYTTLFPDAVRPHHGIFVQERLFAYARRHSAQLAVVAPRPLAPPWGPARWRAWAAAPRQAQLGEVPVRYPRYLSPPGFGDRFRAGLLAAGSRRALRASALALDAQILDAHYAWPDGVAAFRLRPELEAALGRRLPLVITARGTDLNLAPGLPGVRAQLAAALRGADQVVCVAEALRQVALELGVPPERVTTLRNGVDLQRFAPGDRAAARAACGLPAAGTLLLCVGHLDPRKGQQLLLPALAEAGRAGIGEALPAATQLLLVGSGEGEAGLRALAGQLGLAERVRFVGAVPPARLPDYYRAADLLVLPSLREGWPNVLLEALACGTPVLATRVWGTPEVLGTCPAGLLVEPSVAGLSAGLRRSVEWLTADPAARALLQAAARSFAERHGWDATLDGLQALYTRLLQDSASTPPPR
ncbi:MAG: glycosyltransferase [Planctomycetota bacterium]